MPNEHTEPKVEFLDKPVTRETVVADLQGTTDHAGQILPAEAAPGQSWCSAAIAFTAPPNSGKPTVYVVLGMLGPPLLDTEALGFWAQRYSEALSMVLRQNIQGVLAKREKEKG